MLKPVAIDLTENAMRGLWPPKPNLQLDNSTSVSDTTINPAPGTLFSRKREISFSVPAIKTRPKTFRYLKGKIGVDGAFKVEIPLSRNSGKIQEYMGTDVGKRAFAASFEAEVSDKLTIALGGQMEVNNFEEVFIKIGQG